MPENKFMIEDLFLIFDGDIKAEVLIEQIEEITSKYPLSRFGIEPRIVLLNKNEFASKYGNEFDGRIFWLYVNGVVHKFEREITFLEWLDESTTPQWTEFFGKGIPRIVSNVKVYQQVPKTLKTKEEEFNLIKSKFEEVLGMSSFRKVG